LTAFGADLAGSTATNQWVASVSGGGGTGGNVPLNATTLTFGQTQANPNITQAQQANAAQPNDLALTPQAPGAAATNATNGTPGSVEIDLAAPVNGGSEAELIVTSGGTNVIQISRVTGGTATLLTLGIATPGVSSSAVVSDGVSNLSFNTPAGAIGFLQVAGAITAQWQPGGVQLFSPAGAASFGGGVGVLGITNATTPPTTNPTSGGVEYASGGALFWRGSAGTVTQLAPA
jgi:hypothetical protein